GHRAQGAKRLEDTRMTADGWHAANPDSRARYGLSKLRLVRLGSKTQADASGADIDHARDAHHAGMQRGLAFLACSIERRKARQLAQFGQVATVADAHGAGQKSLAHALGRVA